MRYANPYPDFVRLLICVGLAAAPVVLAHSTQAPERLASTVPSDGTDPDTIVVKGKRWLFNRKTRYAHTLPELDGTKINVTKKISVVKLEDQPTVIDNNQRELFDRLPGLVLAEQQNPTQMNVSYRGLGNPQESEYVLLMQDGIPLELDWIGYPTTYYLPVPQTIGSIQMIRGGSGLIYGPEPQPVINFVSRTPDSSHGLAGTSEQVAGSDSLFSSFNAISGSSGAWDYAADYSHRHSAGQRENGAYDLDSGDLHVGYRIDARQKLTVDLHAYSVDSGLAGLMSYGQYLSNRNQTTTPDDRLWTNRYVGAIVYENQFTERALYTQKVWSGYQDLIARSDTYAVAAANSAPAAIAGALSGQRFHFTGLDGRVLHRWGEGNALTVGYTAYISRSPYVEFTGADPFVGRNDESGSLFYDAQRQTRYGALFGESLFRFRQFHLVTSARFDREELWTDESIAPHPALVDRTYRKNIPLFGIGIGNDFGAGNETYLNVSQGFRPLRYLDIASPFSNFSGANNPDPSKYLTYEGGVHGWPILGLYYDVSLFQVNVRNRIESQQLTQTESIDVNTGDTRSRGAEFEAAYDILRLWPRSSSKQHLTLFANASYLNATFTDSSIPGQTGKTPAFAPTFVVKAGVTVRQDPQYKVSLVLDAVGAQYFQDNDQPVAGTPARIPAYTVADFSMDYTIAGHFRLLGGVSNLTDRHYYSRVFLFGGRLEPAKNRAFYAGLAYDL